MFIAQVLGVWSTSSRGYLWDPSSVSSKVGKYLHMHAAMCHNDVVKWKHFPRYWSFVRGIHRSMVNSPHKGQWHGALMFYLICAWINSWVNNREAGDLRRNRAQLQAPWYILKYYKHGVNEWLSFSNCFTPEKVILEYQFPNFYITCTLNQLELQIYNMLVRL